MKHKEDDIISVHKETWKGQANIFNIHLTGQSPSPVGLPKGIQVVRAGDTCELALSSLPPHSPDTQPPPPALPSGVLEPIPTHKSQLLNFQESDKLFD